MLAYESNSEKFSMLLFVCLIRCETELVELQDMSYIDIKEGFNNTEKLEKFSR